MTLRYVDLFCGMGSFHQSFKKLGWTCVMACDNSNAVCKTYEHNFGIKPEGDICDIDPSSLEPYDVLCAGFPCQPFSQIGQHKGVQDARGTMFMQVMRFVKENKPRIILLENVPALLKHDNGSVFEQIVSELRGERYCVSHRVLKCSDYGIPQNRKRLFVVGVKSDESLPPDFESLFWDLEKYRKTTTLSEYLQMPFERDIAYTIRCGGKKSKIGDRHNWDGYIVDGKEHRLTIKEALKLQGFEDYGLQGSTQEQWKMLGNTIPTVFTEIIGLQIHEILTLTLTHT